MVDAVSHFTGQARMSGCWTPLDQRLTALNGPHLKSLLQYKPISIAIFELVAVEHGAQPMAIPA